MNPRRIPAERTYNLPATADPSPPMLEDEELIIDPDDDTSEPLPAGWDDDHHLTQAFAERRGVKILPAAVVIPNIEVEEAMSDTAEILPKGGADENERAAR